MFKDSKEGTAKTDVTMGGVFSTEREDYRDVD